MDNGYATLRCALKVHPRCDACRRQTMEIVSTIVGMYDISFDAERRLSTIVGQVDPNYCLRAIYRCNGHAEVAWANLSHPSIRRGSSYDDYGSPRLTWRGGNVPDYSSCYGRDNIYYDRSYMRRDPYFNPNRDYTIPYHNEEPINLCTIL